jgi:hypothetical protein
MAPCITRCPPITGNDGLAALPAMGWIMQDV